MAQLAKWHQSDIYCETREMARSLKRLKLYYIEEASS